MQEALKRMHESSTATINYEGRIHKLRLGLYVIGNALGGGGGHGRPDPVVHGYPGTRCIAERKSPKAHFQCP